MYILYICMYIHTYSVHEKRNEKGSTPVPRPFWQHFVHSIAVWCVSFYDYILQAAHWSLRFLDYVCTYVLYGGTRNGYKPTPTYLPTYLPYEEGLTNGRWQRRHAMMRMYMQREEKRKEKKEIKNQKNSAGAKPYNYLPTIHLIIIII